MLATLYERYTFLLTGKIPQNLPTEGRLVVHVMAQQHIIMTAGSEASESGHYSLPRLFSLFFFLFFSVNVSQRLPGHWRSGGHESL